MPAGREERREGGEGDFRSGAEWCLFSLQRHAAARTAALVVEEEGEVVDSRLAVHAADHAVGLEDGLDVANVARVLGGRERVAHLLHKRLGVPEVVTGDAGPSRQVEEIAVRVHIPRHQGVQQKLLRAGVHGAAGGAAHGKKKVGSL
jgi:hypothetical protein